MPRSPPILAARCACSRSGTCIRRTTRAAMSSMWRSSVEQLRGAGHEVRVLTTDHREGLPDPAVEEGPDVHRELRWYWSEHEFPRLSLRERLALERHNLSAFDRHRAEFAPDAVVWWAMGGMSMSLLERGRRAGVPAVGVVVDEWLSYGPLVDGWQRACSRPALARVAEALTGVPTRLDLEAAAEWVFVSAYLRERARRRRAGARRRGRGPRGDRRGEVPAGAGAGVGGRAALPGPARSAQGHRDRDRGARRAARAARCAVVGGGDEAHRDHLRALADETGVGERVALRAPRARSRSPAPTPPRTRCSSAPSGRSRSGSCRSRRWPSARPVVATGTGGSAEYLRDARELPPGPAREARAPSPRR